MPLTLLLRGWDCTAETVGLALVPLLLLPVAHMLPALLALPCSALPVACTLPPGDQLFCCWVGVPARVSIADALGEPLGVGERVAAAVKETKGALCVAEPQELAVAGPLALAAAAVSVAAAEALTDNDD